MEPSSPPDAEKRLADWDAVSLHQFPDPSTYSYLIHLRHHGFPSPLLDWTLSPYVAAYFAFRSNMRPASGKVSVYLYSEAPTGFKATGSGKPLIRRVGNHVKTHKRHFLQQSDYTLSLVFSDRWHFVSHEDVFATNDPKQDLLWKFNIPWSERAKVLRLLDSFNLNALSLFDSEEALMETMALREIDLKL